MKFLNLLWLLLLSPLVMAQTPIPTPVDPTLFQSTSFFRLNTGEYETVSPQTRDFAIIDPSTFKIVLDPITGKQKIETEQAYLYDARVPADWKLARGGANYAVLANQNLITFSATWDKPLPKGRLNFEVATFGGNFMIKKGTNEVASVSATGLVNFSSGVIAPAIRIVGGNYFIDANNDLWTIDAKGFVYHLEGTKYPQAYLPGGNYFYQMDGTIVTIASNGLPLPAFTPASKPKTLGGNYYVAEDGLIYSVRYDGNSYRNGPLAGRIRTLGYSYLIYDDNQIHIIDGMGIVHTDAVRVNQTKTRFTKVTTIPDAIDTTSIYTPNSAK